MPPIFFAENETAITMKFIWMIHISLAIRGYFSTKSPSFSTLLPKLSKTPHTSVVKLRLDFRAHHKNFVSIHCHLQNGVHIVHPLQVQTGSTQKVPNLGCGQDGEKQSIPFFRLPQACISCVRPGTIMKEMNIFHVSIRTDCTGCVVAVCLQFPCTTDDLL
jgi:hypothetical protein